MCCFIFVVRQATIWFSELNTSRCLAVAQCWLWSLTIGVAQKRKRTPKLNIDGFPAKNYDCWGHWEIPQFMGIPFCQSFTQKTSRIKPSLTYPYIIIGLQYRHEISWVFITRDAWGSLFESFGTTLFMFPRAEKLCVHQFSASISPAACQGFALLSCCCLTSKLPWVVGNTDMYGWRVEMTTFIHAFADPNWHKELEMSPQQCQALLVGDGLGGSKLSYMVSTCFYRIMAPNPNSMGDCGVKRCLDIPCDRPNGPELICSLGIHLQLHLICSGSCLSQD